MTKRLCLLAVCAALMACSHVPEYVRPAVYVPQDWSSSPVGAGDTLMKNTGNEKADSWRAVFIDPELQRLIALTLEHNRDMAIAVYRVDEARAQAGFARASELPKLEVTSSHEARGSSTNVGRTGFAATSQRYDISVGTISYEADFWGRVRSLDDAARANFLATEYANRAFRLSLIRDVALAWFSLIELRQRQQLTEQTVVAREASLNLIARRRDVGLAGDIDFHQASAALANAQIDRASLARQLSAAERTLQLLAGAPVGLGATVAPSTMANREMVRPLTAGMPAEILMTRPDILAAEEKLIAATANVGAARAAFFPQIALTASAGTASRALSGLFSAGSGTWSFIPALTLPLFDGGRTQDNLDIAQARKHIAVAEYEKAIQSAFRDVATLLAARSHYRTQLDATRVAVGAQAERLRLVEARYTGGVANHLELLDAQRDSYAAQQNLMMVEQQARSVEASLFAALGGH